MADVAVMDINSAVLATGRRAARRNDWAGPVGFQRATRCAAVIAALSLAACASTAAAHEMNIFVQRVEGATIHGRVYFKGGAAAQGVAVRVTDSQGNRLGETTTDADGQFTFVAKTRCDHLFSAELEDGHATRRPGVVRQEQLPANLPGLLQAPGKPDQTAPPTSSAVPASSTESTSSTGQPSAGRLTSPNEPSSGGKSAESIAAQLDDIRERLERMETAVRWRDLLGGIGYILGTAGIAFYLMARRAPQRPAR